MSRATVSASAGLTPRLEARRSAVAELLHSLGAAEREGFGVTLGDTIGAADEVDRANSVLGRDSANLMAEVLSANQVQISHAMERIADGRYGFCESCERPIPAERLNASPEATRCVDCQRRYEQSFALR